MQSKPAINPALVWGLYGVIHRGRLQKLHVYPEPLCPIDIWHCPPNAPLWTHALYEDRRRWSVP